MTPLVSAIITKALDGLALRSVASAQNIANANSASFRPLNVSFEAELAAAAERGEAAVRSLDINAVESGGGQGVRMDLELATQSATALRYGALVDILGRQLALTRSIIRGGQ